MLKTIQYCNINLEFKLIHWLKDRLFAFIHWKKNLWKFCSKAELYLLHFVFTGGIKLLYYSIYLWIFHCLRNPTELLIVHSSSASLNAFQPSCHSLSRLWFTMQSVCFIEVLFSIMEFVKRSAPAPFLHHCNSRLCGGEIRDFNWLTAS